MNSDKIIAIIVPDSAPSRRLMQNAKQNGTAIDATKGRKIRSLIMMENNQVVFSALNPDTILKHFEGNLSDNKNKEDGEIV